MSRISEQDVDTRCWHRTIIYLKCKILDSIGARALFLEGLKYIGARSEPTHKIRFPS